MLKWWFSASTNISEAVYFGNKNSCNKMKYDLNSKLTWGHHIRAAPKDSGDGSLLVYGNVFMSQSWALFCAYHTPAIQVRDCSELNRQTLFIPVLLPQIFGPSVNLHLLTFKFPVNGKSEVIPIYKRLYFFWRKEKNEIWGYWHCHNRGQ